MTTADTTQTIIKRAEPCNADCAPLCLRHGGVGYYGRRSWRWWYALRLRWSQWRWERRYDRRMEKRRRAAGSIHAD